MATLLTNTCWCDPAEISTAEIWSKSLEIYVFPLNNDQIFGNKTKKLSYIPIGNNFCPEKIFPSQGCHAGAPRRGDKTPIFFS